MRKRIKRLMTLLMAIVMIIPMVPLTEAEAVTYSGSASYESGKYYTALNNVKLTGKPRKDIVNVAKSQVGYQEGASYSQLSGMVEGNKNYTEYGRWYGIQDMWSAMFVSWCADRAGIATSIVPKHFYTPSGLKWFKKKGRAYSRATVASGKYTPQAGDIIYFKSSRNSKPTNHVGIVTKYSRGTVYTIEGDTRSAASSTNGGVVAAKSYKITNTYIVYICSPAYKNTSTTSNTTTTNKPAASTATSLISSEIKPIVFDAEYYSSKYSDLKSLYGTDETRLFIHFVKNGVKEGRKASPYFDIKYYVEQNSDLKKAYGTDYVAAMIHFKNYGVNESDRLTAEPVNLGTDFIAKINFTGDINLSISDTNVIAYTSGDKLEQHWKFICQSDGTYKIVNQKNGLCLDVNGGNKASGTNIQVCAENASNAQKWFIFKDDVTGKYVFRPACSSTCAMHVTNSSTSVESDIHSWTYNGSNAQKFTINKIEALSENLGDSFYAKLNFASDKCLSVSAKNVILYKANKEPAQIWKFERQTDGSYKIVNQKTGECLNVNGGAIASGTNVQIYNDNGSAAQRWLIFARDGKYTLTPKCAANCSLTVKDGSTADMTNVEIAASSGANSQKFNISKVNYLDAVQVVDVGTDVYYKITTSYGKNLSLSGTNVIQNAPDTTTSQVWKFERQTDGSYKIVNQTDGVSCLDVDGASAVSGANVQIADDNESNSQRWFISIKEGKYILRPACSPDCVLDVTGGSSKDLTNIETYLFHGSASQRFSLTATDTPAGTTPTVSNEKIAVLRKIIYAVETGGQVYGNVRYDDFTEAYTNSSNEHAITIGAGKWYGVEAKRLLNTIRTTDTDTFDKLDTAGIASDLDTRDWSKYKLSKTSAKAKCIQNIISSSVGVKCQDELLDEQLRGYMKEAENLGVKNLDAQMMCANLRHLGGLGAVKRVLSKTASPYTLDNIYAALQTDTGTQVGTFRSRNKMVYNSLKKYL